MRETEARSRAMEDLQTYVNSFQNGSLSESPDDDYSDDEVDSDGLDLWLRRRGSKAENFHQKMHAAIGPYGIGVESAHYLQVILAYNYLVNAGTRRCDKPNFGHSMLHLEDRIQSRIAEIWGVLPFPNRINVSEYQPLDFISVGVARLSFDEAYVKKGEPADHLKGDLRFYATRSGVKYPPLPPVTKEEFGMIRQFCSKYPQPKMADIQALCRTFNIKANGTTFLPKVPSMIPPAVKRFKINQQAELVKLQTKESYAKIFEEFQRDKTSLPLPPAPATKGKKRKRTTTETNAEATENDDSPRLLPPLFTQPLSAPGQTQRIFMSAATSAIGRCAFWPICSDGVMICGGITEESCKVYGKDGTKTPPSKTALESSKRDMTWTGKSRTQNCYWYPYCNNKAIDCGGIGKAKCSKYGDGGTHFAQRPTDEELKSRKREMKTHLEKKRREAKKNK